MPDPFRLICAMGIAFGLGVVVALADEPVVATKPMTPALPEVFSKSVPETVADLKSLESHLQLLLPKLQAATVAVRIREAHGSGVIVSPNGLIMTAGHVSGKPDRAVEVTLPDGSTVSGRTLGRNRNLDSGLIQINGSRTDWPFCPLISATQSDSLPKLGDWCVAMGHPGGYQTGRTAPLRLGRVILISRFLIQTDCELVGGDSGGPLFNMHGEVIGINSRIGQPLEFNFHVPTSLFHKEWGQLTRSEDLKGSGTALLGLSGKTDAAGLRVTKVYDDEPASRAGIRVGDVLVTFDAKQISDMNELIESVGEMMPGEEVRVELLRDGKRIELLVELDIRWE